MKTSIGTEFIEKTKYKYLEESDQVRRLPQPPLELDYDKSKSIIQLPSPKYIEVEPVSLRKAIESRRSIRDYSGQPMALGELSFLLWCTQGVKEVTTRPATQRTVPSAGARHPFETYLLVNRVEGLGPGIYRFIASKHALLAVSLEPGLTERVQDACIGQALVKNSAVTFIWCAVAYRTTWRYVERGYRYIHLDAGHVCQNLYLAGEAVGVGVCAIGAFDDDKLNNLLGLDGVEQFAVYLAATGKRK